MKKFTKVAAIMAGLLLAGAVSAKDLVLKEIPAEFRGDWHSHEDSTGDFSLRKNMFITDGGCYGPNMKITKKSNGSILLTSPTGGNYTYVAHQDKCRSDSSMGPQRLEMRLAANGRKLITPDDTYYREAQK